MPWLLYVRYYRAEIQGNESRARKRYLRDVDSRAYYDFGCSKPEECICTVCRKLSPSLIPAVSKIVFRLTFRHRASSI
jgi:hypothetical protein